MGVLYNIKKKMAINKAIKQSGSVYDFESRQKMLNFNIKKLNELKDYLIQTGKDATYDYDMHHDYSGEFCEATFSRSFGVVRTTKFYDEGITDLTKVEILLYNGDYAIVDFNQGKISEIVVKDAYGVFTTVDIKELPLKGTNITEDLISNEIRLAIKAGKDTETIK